MRPEDLRALRIEPACDRRQAKPGSCTRSPPGATQGGCCFDGARNALLPISDAAHIVHGPISCAGTSWDTRGSRSSGSSLYRTGLTTALSETDLVMGRGDQRLLEAIGQAVAMFSPPAVFVYVTCLPAMTGADVGAVARAASVRWKLPVIAVDCAGFYGNKNFGQRIAGDALQKHVIGTREPDPIPEIARQRPFVTHDVNLLGEWNVGGEFWSVAPLFDELGLRILCTLSGDSRFRDVQTMHRAEANMLVCSKALLSLARGLEQAFATPYFEGSFYGVTDTSNALRAFARLLRDPDLIDRTESVVTREEAAVQAALLPLRPRLLGKRALIYSGGFKSWSTISAVHDLGMTVVATGVEKSTDEDKVRIRSLLGPDARLLEDNDRRAFCIRSTSAARTSSSPGTATSTRASRHDCHFWTWTTSATSATPATGARSNSPRRSWRPSSIPSGPRCAARPPGGPSSKTPAKARREEPTNPMDIVDSRKALSVNPLTVSRRVGAALAFLGLARSLPLEHGVRGCTAFTKLFFMRHFCEPIALQTTAIDMNSAVLGADANIIEGLRTVIERNHPDVVGLVATTLSEFQGADIPAR